MMPMMLVRQKDRWRRSHRLQLKMLMMSLAGATALTLGSEPPRKGRCRKSRRLEMLLVVPLEMKQRSR